MSRLSRRQHSRKGVREAATERLRLGKLEQAKSFIALMRLAGEKDGHPFRDYDLRRDKVFHDIVLKDGTARFRCYPNADSWHPWSGKDCRLIKDSEVALIRVCAKQPWGDEEEPSDA